MYFLKQTDRHRLINADRKLLTVELFFSYYEYIIMIITIIIGSEDRRILKQNISSELYVHTQII